MDQPPAVIQVIDYGGTLGAAMAKAKLYTDRDTKLVVLYCASSCVMTLLNVPRWNICFTRTAWIGYHSAGWRGGPEPAWRMRWERGTAWINRGYFEC